MKVLFFHGRGCAPCAAFAKHIEIIKKEFPSVEFEEIDCHKNESTACQYAVSSIPTVIVLGGTKETRLVGNALNPSALRDCLRAQLEH